MELILDAATLNRAKARGINLAECEGPPLFLRLTLGGLNIVDAIVPYLKSKGPGTMKGRGRGVIQAGGCLGIFPIYLSKLFDTVFTFEPEYSNFKHLVNNVLRCADPKIFPHNMALGDRVDEVLMSTNRKRDFIDISKWRVGDINVVTTDYHVPMYPLDWLIEEDHLGKNIPPIDLILLDTEGYELPIMRGAINLIKRDHPIIAIETNGCCESYYTWTRADTHDFLIYHGYIKVVDMGGQNAIYIHSGEPK